MAGATLVVRAPCAKCPFRRDVPIYLRQGRRSEIAEGLLEGGTFSCHEQVDYSGDEPDESTAAMCAGAAKALMLAGEVPQAVRWSERLGGTTADQLENSGAPVWSLTEWALRPEGTTEDDDVEPDEVATCSIVNAGCTAPAGYMGSGGGVIYGTEPADSECDVCGEPVCSACLGDNSMCERCLPWDDDDDD